MELSFELLSTPKKTVSIAIRRAHSDSPGTKRTKSAQFASDNDAVFLGVVFLLLLIGLTMRRDERASESMLCAYVTPFRFFRLLRWLILVR